MKPTKTISGYIAAAPREARGMMRRMRAVIRAAAPGCTEAIKWGMPAFCYRRILVCFAAFNHHVGFFPGSEAIRVFKKDLAKFKHGRGSIQLPYDKPLPLPLIRRISAFQARQSKLKDAKWRTHVA